MSDNSILKNLLLNKVAKCINGKEEDLKKLITYTKMTDFTPDPAVTAFIDGLDTSIKEGTNFAKIFLRVGMETSRGYRKKLVTNLIFNQFIMGKMKRDKLANGEDVVPGFIVVSPTMRCNLKCTGCYSGLYTKDGELSEEELDRIFGEIREMGIHFVVISGGEPYLLKDALLRLFKKYSDIFFLTYSTSTFLDE